VQTGPDSGGAQRNESRSLLPLHGIVVFAMLTAMPIVSHLLHDFIWVSPLIVCRRRSDGATIPQIDRWLNGWDGMIDSSFVQPW
jgi:hypothetical protein